MSARLLQCPSCGAEIEGGPYCRFCGASLQSLITERSDIVTDDSKEEIPHIDFGISFSKAEIRTITPLLSQVELGIINDELEDIIEQIRATRQALKLENVESEVLTARAELLRETFEKLKMRKETLLKAPTALMIETVIEDLDLVETKQGKLEDASDALEKDVYKEQKERLKSERQSLVKQIKTESKLLNDWIKEFKKSISKLEKTLGKLEAQFKIGEISRTSYDSSRTELTRLIMLLECSISKMDEIQLLVKSKI